MMNLSFVIIGIISGLILTFWIGTIWHKSYNNLMRNHWIPQTKYDGNLHNNKPCNRIYCNIIFRLDDVCTLYK